MEAKFYQEGEVTVVALSGRLCIEKTPAFRTACLQSLKGKKVVFCMKDLNFVGSTGIQSFFQTIREFNQSKHFTAKISDLKPDFYRLLSFGGAADLEICENMAGALTSFQVPTLNIA
ncbi:STAS domain-containing protein [Bdellovibrio sp. HCB337]|uniref:STAS domain-containing protein n=1 Tax=Bdellovibrio sp. HCB337 TaxID=3394358 RepID=UPI0039A4F08C